MTKRERQSVVVHWVVLTNWLVLLLLTAVYLALLFRTDDDLGHAHPMQWFSAIQMPLFSAALILQGMHYTYFAPEIVSRGEQWMRRRPWLRRLGQGNGRGREQLVTAGRIQIGAGIAILSLQLLVQLLLFLRDP